MNTSTSDLLELKEKRLNLHINSKMYEYCQKAVEDGLAKSVPDFIRYCIATKIEKLYFNELQT